MFIKYNVIVEKFAERYYIKSFERKYKTHWELTFRGIKKILENLDSIRNTSRIEEIKCLNNLVVFKMEFRVANTSHSRKSSGNRCIVSLDKNTKEVKILLVYHKSDVVGKNETVFWQKMIRNNYDGYDFL